MELLFKARSVDRNILITLSEFPPSKEYLWLQFEDIRNGSDILGYAIPVEDLLGKLRLSTTSLNKTHFYQIEGLFCKAKNETENERWKFFKDYNSSLYLQNKNPDGFSFNLHRPQRTHITAKLSAEEFQKFHAILLNKWISTV